MAVFKATESWDLQPTLQPIIPQTFTLSIINPHLIVIHLEVLLQCHLSTFIFVYKSKS